jgi:lysophospholipase L1-like esterase
MMTSVVVSLTVAELALKVLHYKPPLAKSFYLTSDSRIPERDVASINPKFLKDDFYASGGFDRTIVTLGDSFTEGYPVSEGQAYPTVLKALLLDAGCGMNVVNMGQGDSGTDQHLKLFTKYVLPRFTPAVVIWALNANDIGDNVQMAVYTVSDANRLVPLDGPPSWIYTRQRIFEDSPLPSVVKRKSHLFNLLLKSTEHLARWQVPRAYRNDAESWGLRKIQLAAEEMKRLSATYHFDLHFVLIAPQSEYLAEMDSSKWRDDPASIAYRRIQATLRDSVDLIDARLDDLDVPSRVGEGRAAGSGIFADERTDGNRLGDRHFNEVGYRLLAQEVAERVRLRDCPPAPAGTGR